jgi:hypothetical protein
MKPDSKFIFAELPPLVWMYDDSFRQLRYSYVNKEATVETNPGTYTEKDATIELTEIKWHHSLVKVFNSLMSKNLKVRHFQEYKYSPHKCFKRMTELFTGKFIVENTQGKVPMCYSLLIGF